MSRLILMLLLCLIAGTGFSQEYGFGGGMILSTPEKNFGLDLRMSIPMDYYGIDLLEGIWLVPQLSYYPAGNKYLDLGTSMHIGAYRLKEQLFYGLTNISYSMWLNYNNSNEGNAKFSNLNWELGAGWTTSKCFRPFAEIRTDVIQFEFNIRAGIIYTINCKNYGQVPCSKLPKVTFPPELE
jgi:hypothetical protein